MIREIKTNVVYVGFKFQEAIGEMFKKYGFTIYPEFEDKIISGNFFDFKIESMEYGMETKKYLVEVKYFTQNVIRKSFDKFVERYNMCKSDYNGGIIVCNQKIKQNVKDEYLSIGIIIIDSIVLEYMFTKNESLKYEISTFFSYATENISINEDEEFSKDFKEKLEELSFTKTIDISSESKLSKENLINKLQNLNYGKEDNADKRFEELSFDIIKYLFTDNLIINDKSMQITTKDELNRFDCVFRVKKDNQSDLWDMIDNKLNSHYVVFEFKNYSNPIKQGQIYTTEKYLYAKALRTVAFIFARNGADNNAIKATEGIARETGKIIIVLDDNDLINMINAKEENQHENFMNDKLDNFFITLGK